MTAYDELLKIDALDAAGSIKSKYAEGKILHGVYKEMQDAGIRKLAEVLKWDYADTCYRLKFAVAFNAAMLGDVLALRTPTGKALSWAHVRVSLRVDDDERRMKLLKLAAESEMPYADFLLKIQSEKPGKRAAGAGAKLKLPRNLAAGIHSISKFTGDWLKRQETVFAPHVLGRFLAGIPLDDVDDDLVTSVEAAATQLEAMAEAAAEDAKVLKAAGKQLKHKRDAAVSRGEQAAEAPAKPKTARHAPVAPRATPVTARAQKAARTARDRGQ